MAADGAGRRRFHLDTAGGIEERDRTACAQIPRAAEVDFADDRDLRLDRDPRHREVFQRHGQKIRGFAGRFVRGGRHAHGVGFAAAAEGHLRFEHDRTAETFRRRSRFGGGGSGQAAVERQAESAEQGPRLVFEQPHEARMRSCKSCKKRAAAAPSTAR